MAEPVQRRLSELPQTATSKIKRLELARHLAAPSDTATATATATATSDTSPAADLTAGSR
jgi:hypothetical protein